MSWLEDHHAEWLSLVETSGPFLSVSVLKKALPNGLSDAPAIADLRLAQTELQHDPALERRFVDWVLSDLLGFADNVMPATDTDPQHVVAESGVRIRPTHVVRDPGRDGQPVLLVHRYRSGTPLDRPLTDGWAASPIDRAVELARASRVSLALVTDAQRWTLVWARPGETTGTCTWRSELWTEEPITLRAFTEFLGARRFFALPTEQSLANLLQDSASRQQEVADQLGEQVRRATELLISTLDREDRDRHGTLLLELPADEVYKGATTVMMRLVFLFVAEERKLLPLDDPAFAETLAASTLRGELRERADRYDEAILERSNAAWHRLLALFRAVHGGVEHDALRLPAYGGGLFDPDRYPFLEGRQPGTSWRDSPAEPLPVDDRTVLHILDQLQTLEQGGVRVQLSYQALDVEQIGHVYEGLLDHTAVRIDDAALGLAGKLEPEIAVRDIERWDADGSLVKHLAKETGRTTRAIEKALAIDLDDTAATRLRRACEADEHTFDRVRAYHALLRTDLRGDPLVFPAGALYVTQAIDRRASGTYYTPRQLAEEVVRHTLDPVAFEPGPATEPDPAKWGLKSSGELLDLKVADIAMGSGAFLVAAARYLAARLLEAWERESDPRSYEVDKAMDEPTPIPADPADREMLAHRLVVERCLYGVDKNPMAVEMAKLSLWLITLAKDRPFSFVDHALRTGDSLLGVTSMNQLKVAHLDPKHPRQASLDLGIGELEAATDRTLELREELETFVVRDTTDAARKHTLLDQADEAMEDAKLLADLVVGAALAQQPDADPLVATNVAGNTREMLAGASAEERDIARTRLRDLSERWLVERRPGVGEVEEVVWADRRPLHWALEFPEVTARGGFDAIVGNPPFQGGKKITGALGDLYRAYLVEWLADGVRGHADLVAYFYLRASRLLRTTGGFGLIATNTLAQGDTREVGLDQLTDRGMTIHRAVSSEPWPGGASLEMATVWARRKWTGAFELDREPAPGITSSLAARSRIDGPAHALAGLKRAFQGSVVVGMGFVLTPDEAQAMVRADARNSEVIQPYLVGQDLNTRPDGSPARWVINFRDWPIERAAEYAAPFARVDRLVRPARAKVKRDTHRERWWQYGDRRPALYNAIAPLDRCIAITLVSKVVQPMFVPTDIVFAHALGVFAYDGDGHFGLLSNGFHWWWAVTRASTLETRVRYTPTDCFETFAQPTLTDKIAEQGALLHEHRSALMLDRQEGLTTTYNRVHNPDETADDIVRLREIHVALDHAVRDAYGWSDLDLDHGFHDTKFGTRFTFAPVPRQEVLDRLLKLNHERYAEEVRQGLHTKKKQRKRSNTPTADSLF